MTFVVAYTFSQLCTVFLNQKKPKKTDIGSKGTLILYERPASMIKPWKIKFKPTVK